MTPSSPIASDVCQKASYEAGSLTTPGLFCLVTYIPNMDFVSKLTMLADSRSERDFISPSLGAAPGVMRVLKSREFV